MSPRLLAIFILFWSETIYTQSTLLRYYDYGNRDELYDFEQTADGGFILFGIRQNNAVELGFSSVVTKVDSIGEEEWSVLLDDSLVGSMCGDFLNVCNYNNFIHRTSDHGYLLSKASYWAGIYWTATQKLDSVGNEMWTHVYYSPVLHAVAGMYFTPDDGYLINSLVGDQFYYLLADSEGITINEAVAYTNNDLWVQDPKTAPMDSNFLFSSRTYINNFGWKYSTSLCKLSHAGIKHDSITIKGYYALPEVTVDNQVMLAGNTAETLGEFANWDGFQFLKLDEHLDTMWVRSYPSMKKYRPYHIDKTPSGGFMVLLHRDDIDSMYLWNINADGDSLWLKTILPFGPYFPHSMKVLQSGYIAICGEYKDPDLGDNKDFFFMVTDPTGNVYYATLTGSVYYDQNDNEIKDPEDINIPNVMVTCEPGGYHAMTDSAGNFALNTYITSTFEVSAADPLYFYQSTPADPTYSVVDVPEFDSTYDAGNFGKAVDLQVKDVLVNIRGDLFLPDFSNDFSIVISNIGTIELTDLDVQLQLHNGIEIYSPGVGIIENDTTIIWHIDTLSLFEQVIYPYTLTGTSTEIGDTLNITAWSEPFATDINPINNYDTLSIIATGAIDPNNKVASPSGEGPEGYISPDVRSITYTINFQNVGTAPAQFIDIIDTLDSDFSLDDFSLLVASHNYSISFPANNVIKWHFADIQLPDSSVNYEESQGFVMYTIEIPEETPLETQFTNKAYIYFDYNDPIATNTTTHTIHKEEPESNTGNENYFNILPMPSVGGLVNFETNITGTIAFTIYNILGQKVVSISIDPSTTSTLDLQSLRSGWYTFTVNGSQLAGIDGKILILN